MIDRDLKDIRINLNFIRDIAEYFLQDSPPDAAIEDCDQLDSIADDLEAMQVAYNNHLTMLEAVRGRSFEHSLTVRPLSFILNSYYALSWVDDRPLLTYLLNDCLFAVVANKL